jgi:hypothetical protein
MLSSRDRREMQTEAAKSQAQAADRGDVTRQRIARCQAQEAVEEMPQDRFATSQALAEDRGEVDRGLQDVKLKKHRQRRCLQRFARCQAQETETEEMLTEVCKMSSSSSRQTRCCKTEVCNISKAIIIRRRRLRKRRITCVRAES